MSYIYIYVENNLTMQSKVGKNDQTAVNKTILLKVIFLTVTKYEIISVTSHFLAFKNTNKILGSNIENNNFSMLEQVSYLEGIKFCV